MADDKKDPVLDDKPFAGLDLRQARCFGYSVPASKNWLLIATLADYIGWRMVDAKQIEKNLALDVDKSYFRIAAYSLTNVDDDVDYALSFDNSKQLWQVEIANSPKAELAVEERADFFKSDMFKKIAKKTYLRLSSAKDIYHKIVEEHLLNGEMLLVDTVKLDAILHFLDSDFFMKNIASGKYLAF